MEMMARMGQIGWYEVGGETNSESARKKIAIELMFGEIMNDNE